MAAPADIVLDSLQGGMNDTDAPTILPDDQCVLAENVEFFFSPLGERRKGCIPLNIAAAGLEAEAAIVHLSEWFPTNIPTEPEWWAMGATTDLSVSVARHNGTDRLWHPVTPDDAFDLTAPNIYQIKAQPLSSVIPLDFFAYASTEDRLHVWDQTYLRRAGLAEPAAAPTAADTGAGAYDTIRYFRIRYIDQNGAGTIVRRSEPSESVTFTPSGTGSGAMVTRPALLGERETHWELEASLDNSTFYPVQTLPVATVSATDTTLAADGYSSVNNGLVSEEIGTYLLLPAAKYIAAEGDRLVGGGHFTDPTQQSDVWWSPVSNDPGVGNAERLPLTVNNKVRLDNGAGGEVTGIGNGAAGTWYAFKFSRIYALIRTNNINRAYDVSTVSTVHGAIPGSVFSGNDELGRPCTYFLDPQTGPMRIGRQGLQALYGLQTTWARVNLHAQLPACGCFYPYKQQAMWWIAVDGSNTPSLQIKSQVDSLKPTATSGSGVARGWSTSTGRLAEAYTACALTSVTIINDVDSLSARPCIGLTSPDFIQITDVGSLDAGQAYTARIRTKPYIAAGLLNRWGVLVAALLAAPSTTTSVKILLIRDFGVETIELTTDLTPEAAETYVIKRLDDLHLVDASVIEIEFTDA